MDWRSHPARSPMLPLPWRQTPLPSAKSSPRFQDPEPPPAPPATANTLPPASLANPQSPHFGALSALPLLADVPYPQFLQTAGPTSSIWGNPSRVGGSAAPIFLDVVHHFR